LKYKCEADGIALYGATWRNFFEQATLIAGGPGVTFLFWLSGSTNRGVSFMSGIHSLTVTMRKFSSIS